MSSNEGEDIVYGSAIEGVPSVYHGGTEKPNPHGSWESSPHLRTCLLHYHAKH